MKSNILSIGQLLERGFIIHMEDKFHALCDAKGQLVVKVAMSNNWIFLIYLNTFIGTCLLVKYSESWRWRLWFGHLKFGGLQLLRKTGMVHGLPKIEKPDHVFEVCTLDKQHWLPFLKGQSWREKQPLQLAHTDICGSLVPVSHGGNNYFITFIDDYSRKTWVYFLKEKSAAFEVFKSFKNLVENESGYKIKTLRSNRGGEYTSKRF
jgi:Integrase core domain